jgi:hypothetical protein
MICPNSNFECDNPGCRRGGCQGRRPKLPLFRAPSATPAKSLSLFEPEIAGGVTALRTASLPKEGVAGRQLVTA